MGTSRSTRRAIISGLVQDNLQPGSVTRKTGRALPPRPQPQRAARSGALLGVLASLVVIGLRSFSPTSGIVGGGGLASGLFGFTPVTFAATGTPRRLPAAPLTAPALNPLEETPLHGPQGLGEVVQHEAVAFLQGGDRDTLSRIFRLGVQRIVLDPGHGGRDPGTVGPSTGLTEKEIALDICKRTQALLVANMDLDVILTRSTDQTLRLHERPRLANRRHADLFVSVHVNFFPVKERRGIETYYLGFPTGQGATETAIRENAAAEETIADFDGLISRMLTTLKLEESAELAWRVHRSMIKGMRKVHAEHITDLGVRRAPFVVLVGARMPSILAEVSYLNDHDEELRLSDGAYRDKIAQMLYQGIRRYVDERS